MTSSYLQAPDSSYEGVEEAVRKGSIECGDRVYGNTHREYRHLYKIEDWCDIATDVKRMTFETCNSHTDYDTGLSIWRRKRPRNGEDDGDENGSEDDEWEMLDQNDDSCGSKSKLANIRVCEVSPNTYTYDHYVQIGMRMCA